MKKINHITACILGLLSSFSALADNPIPTPKVEIHTRLGHVLATPPEPVDNSVTISWKMGGTDSSRAFAAELGFKVELSDGTDRHVIAIINPKPYGSDFETDYGYITTNAIVPNQNYTAYVTAFDRLGNTSLTGETNFSSTKPDEVACRSTTSCGVEGVTTTDMGDGITEISWTPTCGAHCYEIYNGSTYLTRTTGGENFAFLGADTPANNIVVKKCGCESGPSGTCPASHPAFIATSVTQGRCTTNPALSSTPGGCGDTSPFNGLPLYPSSCTTQQNSCGNTSPLAIFSMGIESPTSCFPFRCCLPVESQLDSRCPANKPKAWSWIINQGGMPQWLWSSLYSEFATSCGSHYWMGTVISAINGGTDHVKLCCHNQ